MTVLFVLALNHAALTRSTPVATPSSGAALGPVSVAAPPSGTAAARGCPAVISHLPVAIGGQHARPAQSISPYVAAWGEPPIVLRCGVPRPAAFVQTSELTVINGVQWLPERHPDATMWTVVDREVYVEVTVDKVFNTILRYPGIPQTVDVTRQVTIRVQ